MGLFGMIGKMAGSKVVEKVEDELTKKQNREQTSKYCVYINNNLTRVCKLLADLLNETQGLVGEITSMKGVKMSFREKVILEKPRIRQTRIFNISTWLETSSPHCQRMRVAFYCKMKS